MTQAVFAAEHGRFTSIHRRVTTWSEKVLGSKFQKYCSEQVWSPSVNMCEHDEYYCVVVDLAGMTAARIDLRVEDGVLVVTGERGMPESPDLKDVMCVHLMEIDHGRFCRAIELPDDVNADRIEAKYCSGYLWIKMYKK